MLRLRKLRPLPLFFLIWGAYVPFFCSLWFGESLRAVLDARLIEVLASVVWLLTVTGIPIYFFWRLRLPFELRATLPDELRPSLRAFPFIYWLPGIKIAITAFLFAVSDGLLNLFGVNLGGWGYVMIPYLYLSIFVAYLISYVYTSYLTARLLRTAELLGHPRFSEMAGTFLLVMMGVFGAPFLANRYRALEDHVAELV